ncbi:hypothetical protein D3C79_685580 [compost metagenome]
MLRNSAAPADYLWSQADQTISMLLAAQDTLSYYKTHAGSLEKQLSVTKIRPTTKAHLA